LKLEKGDLQCIKIISKGKKRGMEYTHHQGKGISNNKHSLYKGVHGDGQRTKNIAC
jgi:hypothetical protein